MTDELLEKYKSSPLFGGNAAFVDALYEQYLRDPSSVDERWRAYFRGLGETEPGRPGDIPHAPIRESFAKYARSRVNGFAGGHGLAPEAAQRQAAVLRLINGYRVRGHQAARLDPLELHERPYIPDLDPAFHGLSEQDMDSLFNTGSLFTKDQLPLRRILDLVRNVYTGTIGSEYMHITDTAQKRWIQQRLEAGYGEDQFTGAQRQRILRMLTAAEGIEKYLHTRYVGQKRFSLEGGESLIPQLDELVDRSVGHGIEEMVIGMAHRGRLNVLVNILGKSPRELFEEFEGKIDPDHMLGSGDVKYHMGFSSDLKVDGRQVHLALAFNPSHLEIVNPVVEGSVRARQHRRKDVEGNQVLPVLIHGDASFSGQGVVMEGFNMSQARGFSAGGTVHIIVNNQIGFTTSNPLDARSTLYCTDVAKMVQAPIFHVNADDPEAVLFVTRLALDFRMEFHKDVVIDLVCYRRHGHNEADEPAVTQPMMYQKIKQHPSARTLYADRLAELGVLGKDNASALVDGYRDALDEGRNVVRDTLGMVGNEFTADWNRYNRNGWDEALDTTLPLDRIRGLSERLTTLPEGLDLHPRVARIIDDRRKMAAGALPVDWGFAETMAYAALLDEGYPVRLVGQDTARGTFFHRHSVLYNQSANGSYVPLAHVSEDQADFIVIDSLLSEAAVLGFEYGYATADPNTLVIWEAQFGDFANGAQVVIDQFISSGEAKWRRLCGLVMFLPHGHEGQGPEHSSARLERYLQLCAEQNMQVCVPSTPAQMYHMLRRQMLRAYRKPLVVMTPKSLLRRRLSTSSLEDLSDGHFHCVIPEIDDLTKSRVKKLVFCSGKVYYDLLEKRRQEEITDIALIRIEQLYPFPTEEFAKVIKSYPNAREVVWCQEEPRNQGAWYQIQHRLREGMKSTQALTYAGRAPSASTAPGYHELFVKQQKALINDALGLSGEGTGRGASSKKKSGPKKTAETA
ncbi:MAG TPA: 2-oxoglutarate dehydrogenase E1 component [Gammaproteobacteria bacterium]|nr:2-oxoglutarate dehydrogenase E1 component [Gammaproteobacteria bacterium]